MYLFLDVRPRHQYDICSLPLPFQSLPFDEFDAQKTSFFDMHLQDSAKEVYVYTICRRGVASQKAAKLLVDWGFKNVYNIDSKKFNNFLTPKMSVKRKPLIEYILNKNNKYNLKK